MASSRRASSTAARVVKAALDVAWFVLLVGSVMAAGVIIAAMALGAHPYLDFPVAFAIHGTYAVAGSGQHASVVGAGGQLRLRPPVEVVALGLVFVAAGIAFALVVLAQLRALVGQALAGSPFGTGAARRVRLIGVAIVVMEATRALVVLAGSAWARSHVSGPGLSFRASFPLDLAVVGLGVLVAALGEVFPIGEALQADHDLTI
ncbi:MAG: DUF2975 domain-containing protein [Mycobacteriales bacterium]